MHRFAVEFRHAVRCTRGIAHPRVSPFGRMRTQSTAGAVSAPIGDGHAGRAPVRNPPTGHRRSRQRTLGITDMRAGGSVSRLVNTDSSVWERPG
jgi:hypothetical protein